VIASTVKKSGNPLELVNDPTILRRAHLSRYEYVDVVFGLANTNLPIPTTLRPENPEEIRWQDVTPNTVTVASVETPTFVYRSSGADKIAFTATHITLRATQTGYQTRLLLFLERT
jgi:hypothetical protein